MFGYDPEPYYKYCKKWHYSQSLNQKGNVTFSSFHLFYTYNVYLSYSLQKKITTKLQIAKLYVVVWSITDFAILLGPT